MSASSNDPLAVGKLRTEVLALTARVARGEKQRKKFFVMGIGLILGFAVLLTLYVGMLQGRAHSRSYYNQQDRQHSRDIRDLACAWSGSEPGNPVAAVTAAKYHCPAPTGATP